MQNKKVAPEEYGIAVAEYLALTDEEKAEILAALQDNYVQHLAGCIFYALLSAEGYADVIVSE